MLHHSLWPEILAVQGFGFIKFSLTLFLIGNDLARALRWGAGYTGEKVMNVLRSVEDANLIKLDRQVEREGREGEGKGGKEVGNVGRLVGREGRERERRKEGRREIFDVVCFRLVTVLHKATTDHNEDSDLNSNEYNSLSSLFMLSPSTPSFLLPLPEQVGCDIL